MKKYIFATEKKYLIFMIKKTLWIWAGCSLLLSCDLDETNAGQAVEVEKEVLIEVPKNLTPTKVEISSQEIVDNGSVMFTPDDEQVINGKKILYTDELRAFKSNAMLEAVQIGNKFRVRNFLPYTFRNLELHIHIKGLPKPLKFATFAEIPAHAFYEGELPFKNEKIFLEDIDGKIISLERSLKLRKEDISLSFEGQDPMLAKLKTINIDHYYTFGYNYNQPGKWDALTLTDARNYLPLICNFAYVLSSDEFKEALLNAPYELEEGCTNCPSSTPLYNAVAKTEVYRRILLTRTQNLGIIVQPGLGGLGGGDAFGVRREYLTKDFSGQTSVFYNKNINYYHSSFLRFPMEAFVHEYGHVLGYTHSGNMTYFYQDNATQTLKGFVPLFMYVYRQMQETERLPFNEYPY